MKKPFLISIPMVTLLLLSCAKEDTQPSVRSENSLTEKIQTHSNLTTLDIYKDPNCGCCTKWVDSLAENQFKTNAINTDDISSIKLAHGIEAKYQSCHTAISSQGYVFEGHIPAKFIKQFLNEKPLDAIGLSVPAMPVGTPGMEVDSKFQPYKILKLMKNGEVQVYAEITQAAQQN